MSSHIAPSVARNALACFALSLSLVACAGQDAPRTFEVAPALPVATHAQLMAPATATRPLPSAPPPSPVIRPISFTPGPLAAPISECQANFEARIADALYAIEHRRI